MTNDWIRNRISSAGDNILLLEVLFYLDRRGLLGLARKEVTPFGKYKFFSKFSTINGLGFVFTSYYLRLASHTISLTKIKSREFSLDLRSQNFLLSFAILTLDFIQSLRL